MTLSQKLSRQFLIGKMMNYKMARYQFVQFDPNKAIKQIVTALLGQVMSFPKHF